MLVVSRINNNVVQVEQHNQRLIVLGKGIGFGVHEGEPVNEALIEHTFVLQDTMSLEYFVSVVNDTSLEDILLVKEIITLAEQMLDMTINPNLLVALLDHLNFAFQREKEQITIQDPLQWEIRELYPQELQVGKEAVAIINKQKNIHLPLEEEVLIAHHFINTQLEQQGTTTIDELNSIIDAVLQIIMYHFHRKITKESINFTRFVTHLRHYIIRQMQHECADIADADLLELVKVKYEDEYACAEKIATYVENRYHGASTSGEKMYLTLHLHRVLERDALNLKGMNKDE